MAAFINIFDLNKLNEYSSIIEKSANIKVDLAKTEHSEKMVKLSKFILENSSKNAEEYFFPKMNEMKTYILADIILDTNEMKERKKMVEKYLPENKDAFMYLLELLDKKENS